MKNRFISDPSNKLLAMTMMLVAVITAIVRCSNQPTVVTESTIPTSIQIVYSDIFSQDFEKISDNLNSINLNPTNYIYFLAQEKIYIEEVYLVSVSSELTAKASVLERKNLSDIPVVLWNHTDKLVDSYLLADLSDDLDSESNDVETSVSEDAEIIVVEIVEVAEPEVEPIEPETSVSENAVSENTIEAADSVETASNDAVPEEIPEDTYFWDGPVLTARKGVNAGPTGKETYYNLPMGGVINIMRNMGYTDEYWVREDGVKMFGDYVMVAANLSVFPRGSIVPTSLGLGRVCDSGGFAESNPTQLDIAVTW